MKPGFDILAAIDRAALQKRGTLRAWMTENRAAFEERLLTLKPDWPTLAGVFAAAGLLDSRGKPPTAEATRKTWQRVKGPVRTKTAAAHKKLDEVSAESKLKAPAPAPSPPKPTMIEQPDPPDDPPPRHTFRPAKIR